MLQIFPTELFFLLDRLGNVMHQGWPQEHRDSIFVNRRTDPRGTFPGADQRSPGIR